MAEELNLDKELEFDGEGEILAPNSVTFLVAS
jgi:hypothetical protein